jgi:hypothetical protein
MSDEKGQKRSVNRGMIKTKRQYEFASGCCKLLIEDGCFLVCCATTQKTAIFILVTVRTWNLNKLFGFFNGNKHILTSEVLYRQVIFTAK